MKKLASFMLATAAACAFADDLTLVKDGKPAAEIVLAEKATRAAQLGALEIQHNVKLKTGAELPIVTESKAGNGAKIYVGHSDAAAKLGLKKEDYTGEQYEVKFFDSAAALLGNDSQNFGKVIRNDCGTLPRTFTHETYATLFAVYDFLEKGCDIHFYGPGDDFTTFAPAKDLTVKPFSVKRSPALSAFRYIYAPSFQLVNDAKAQISPADMTLWKLRWRENVLYADANHNFPSIYYRYWGPSNNEEALKRKVFIEKRPEYFARGYRNLTSDMTRWYPDDPDLPPQVCLTSRGAIKYFAQAAVDAYDGKPHFGSQPATKTAGCPFFYPMVENDNVSFCKCETCVEMFKDKGDLKQSYLHNWFIGEIAREAAKLDPAVGISTLAYSNYAHFPHGLDLPENIAVQMVPHPAAWAYKPLEDYEMRIFNDWTDPKTGGGNRVFTLWTHFLAPCWDAKFIGKYNDYFPVFFYQKMYDFFTYAAKRGVRGWFSETPLEVGYSYFHTQLELYVCMRLCDDPTLSREELIENFFPRFYGEAAAPMRNFYRLIEEVSMNRKNYPAEFSADYNGTKRPKLAVYPEDLVWGTLGTKERMDQLQKHMDEAKSLAKTEIVRKRVAMFEKGLWDSMKKGRAAYEQKLKFMTRPAPEITAPKIAGAGGDPEKADWSKAKSTGELKTMFGFPGANSRTIQLAHDGKYLYLKFTEKYDPAKLNSNTLSLWEGETFEIFFARGDEPPYHQYGTNAKGTSAGIKYILTADLAQNVKCDFGVRQKITAEKDSLTILLSIPLDKLLPDSAAKPGETFRANFFRGEPGKISCAWSPPFHNGFHDLKRMGIITLEQ